MFIMFEDLNFKSCQNIFKIGFVCKASLPETQMCKQSTNLTSYSTNKIDTIFESSEKSMGELHCTSVVQ